jgi:hypothetical protein
LAAVRRSATGDGVPAEASRVIDRMAEAVAERHPRSVRWSSVRTISYTTENPEVRQRQTLGKLHADRDGRALLLGKL